MDASLLGATVVVADTFAFRASEFVELVKVLCQGGVSQVARRSAAQSTELVVWRIKTRVEQRGVKLISANATRERKSNR